MTLEEAKQLLDELTCNWPFTEKEKFQINELSRFIFDQEKTPEYPFYLASEILHKGNYDLALYYYELAIQYGYGPGYYSAAELYQEGNLSSGKDLKKAFEYYTIASKCKSVGEGTFESPINDVHHAAKFKLALMYKNGEYVEQDYKKYKRMVNQVYKAIQDEEYDPERYLVFNEKAKILIEEGKKEEACDCLFDSIAEQLYYFDMIKDIDELNDMEKTVDMLYELIEFDHIDIGFKDLFYMFKKPCKVKFSYAGKEHTIESLEENNSMVLKLDDKWYRDILDMISRARFDDYELIDIYLEIDTWEVLEWKN